jgi:hypothetical protein
MSDDTNSKKSKLRWRTPPQATGYVRATAIFVMELGLKHLKYKIKHIRLCD